MNDNCNQTQISTKTAARVLQFNAFHYLVVDIFFNYSVVVVLSIIRSQRGWSKLTFRSFNLMINKADSLL